MHESDRFTSWFFERLCAHLDAREKASAAVSRLGYGASFESWLAFEARLAIEDDPIGLRHALGVPLDEPVSTANEWPHKVDLSVHRGDGELLAAVELKLVHNNKDWREKCDQIWRDLFPTRPMKAAMSPSLGRFAVVAMIWKRYTDWRGVYPGQDDAARDDWRRKVDDYLVPPAGRSGQRLAYVPGLESRLGFAKPPTWMIQDAAHGLDLVIVRAV